MFNFGTKRILFFILTASILFFLDKFTLIPIWARSVSPFMAYFVNIVFIVAISVIIVAFFVDDTIIGDVLTDIDSKDLERLYKTMQEIASVDGQIPIQVLAKTWQEKDTPKQRLEKLLDKDNIDIDISQLNIYWRNTNPDNQVQISDQFSSSFTVEMFNKVNSFIQSKNIDIESRIGSFYKPYLDLIMYLFKTLDTKGFVPSLVDIRVNSRDPDVLRKSVSIADSNQYELLSQINLIDHTSRVVNNVVAECKRLKCSADISILSIIAALAHDIGKIPSYYEQIGNNSMVHQQVSAEFISNSVFAKSIDNKVLNIILESISKHHNAEKITKISTANFDSSMYAKNYITILEAKNIVQNTDQDYIDSLPDEILNLGRTDMSDKEISDLLNLVMKIVVKADENARVSETKIMQNHILAQSKDFPKPKPVVDPDKDNSKQNDSSLNTNPQQEQSSDKKPEQKKDNMHSDLNINTNDKLLTDTINIADQIASQIQAKK